MRSLKVSWDNNWKFKKFKISSFQISSRCRHCRTIASSSPAGGRRSASRISSAKFCSTPPCWFHSHSNSTARRSPGSAPSSLISSAGRSSSTDATPASTRRHGNGTQPPSSTIYCRESIKDNFFVFPCDPCDISCNKTRVGCWRQRGNFWFFILTQTLPLSNAYLCTHNWGVVH